MTPSLSYYDRLVASVGRIARHAYYPGIEQTLDQCLEDIDALRTPSGSPPSSGSASAHRPGGLAPRRLSPARGVSRLGSHTILVRARRLVGKLGFGGEITVDVAGGWTT